MWKVFCATVVAVVLAGCSDGGSRADISLTADRRFQPEELTVGIGHTVTWSNESAEAHTVTAYEEGIPAGAAFFASGGEPSEESARDEVGDGLLTADETFEVTFQEPGTYRYFCIPHEDAGMVGRIVVEE